MRLSEVFETTQGEGPKVGLPSIFIRFAGCNLRCPTWACDTPYAIDPKLYRKEWETIAWEQVYERTTKLEHYETIPNIVISGGEPFMQLECDLYQLLRRLHADDKEIEIFTNGTVEFPPWINNVSIVMDWKLPGSGERIELLEHAMFENAKQLKFGHDRGATHAIKFTVMDRDDFYVAKQRYADLSLRGSNNLMIPTFCGPVWDKTSVSEAIVAQWIIEDALPWRLNIQSHKYVYGDRRGV